jgi:eukaryotic-like serine/threonine-protein kinase
MSEEPAPSLWSELKERKVIRVAIAYTAIGWAVVVGGSELSQILELPTWVPKLILTLVVLGLPVALVLAWAFELTPEGMRRADPLPSPSGGRPSRKPFFAGVAVGISAISLLAFLMSEDAVDGGGVGASSIGVVADADLVAILPFRYSGPTELDYLGDGVFQLLASRFTGEIGPRATDPTATVAVWDQASAVDPTTAAMTVAARLGAGSVLTGGVVAGPGGLTLTASLRDAATDAELAAASAQGPADSLAAVVERLAGRILSLSIGEYSESLEQLTSADPGALREYLRGQVEFRSGRWIDARDHFERAVEADSTFALAAIWAADSGNNIPGAAFQPYLELAWRHQERLSERDRVYLRARLGPGHPGPDTREERRRAYEAAARITPDRANVWYWLGESTLHAPRGPEDVDRALQYFRRAVELDPRNPNALLHLMLPHQLRGDLEGAIDALERIATLDTSRVAQLSPRYWRALSERDSTRAVMLYDSLHLEDGFFFFGVPFDAPALLVGEWQVDAILGGLEQRRSRLTPSDPFAMSTYFNLYYSYQDLGLAESANGALTEFERATGNRYDRMRVFDALYGALPESVGRAAAERLEGEIDAVSEEEWTPVWAGQLAAVEMWRVLHDDLSRVSETTRRIRAAGAGRPPATSAAMEGLALLLEAMAQVRSDDPAARETIEAFDELFLRGPTYGVELYDAMVLATSEVYERTGDPATALRVLERESNFNNFRWPYGARFARERGRLASIIGDTARAMREYEYYTILRSRADVTFQDEVQEVRAELEALRGG